MMVARLLHGIRASPLTLTGHLQVHGPLPTPKPTALIAEIERSGVRGRGGGAFPLARKLTAVKRSRGRPTVSSTAARANRSASKTVCCSACFRTSCSTVR
jgi:NADH:ubiquinone oxidoreductase subunit F (NADH-binding)